jgi:hypothetical protein
MIPDEQEKPSQRQDSRQSAGQGANQKSTGTPPPGKTQGEAGIGASQGQDRGSPSEQQQPRPSAGTPDIERGSSRDTGEDAGSSTESLVKDPTGAFKERP